MSDVLLTTCENQSKAPATAGSLKSTVLVVDDDESFRDLARGVLEPDGFQVIEADGVRQGLLRLRSATVHGIVLDIVMPDRDGLQGVEDIRKVAPKTKIVTVSGARDAEEFLTVSGYLGADASLLKSQVASLGSLLDVLLDR
jgi:DNA-binding response OmpR family regulator